MKKEQFQIIYSAITLRVELCRTKLDNINSREDLQKLTIREAQELRDFCTNEVSIMTKICQTDLYHIIGMGELTPPQMTQFCFAVRDYLQYRSIVKTLASHFNSISLLPNIPTESSYELSALAPIVLNSGTGAPKLIRNWELSLASKEISFTFDKLESFIADLHRIFNTNMYSVKKFLNRLQTKREYAGIKWQLEGNIVRGKILYDHHWEKLYAAYMKKL